MARKTQNMGASLRDRAGGPDGPEPLCVSAKGAHPLRFSSAVDFAFYCGRTTAARGDRHTENPFVSSKQHEFCEAWSRGYYLHRPWPGSSESSRYKERRAKAIVERHGMICWLCHKPILPPQFSLDHIKPKSRGGRGVKANLRPCHKSCNSRRGNKKPPVLHLRKDMIVGGANG
jgi:hypothetical protein